MMDSRRLCALVLTWLLARGVLARGLEAADRADDLHRPPRRVPWTASRLAGSPEPPLPYVVSKTFVELEWKAPLYIAPEPGSDRLLVVLTGGEPERPSRILRIIDDPAAREAELFLEVERHLVYSVAFHPRYVENGQLYLFTNGVTGEAERTDRIVRYHVERAAPWRIDTDSAEVIIEWRSAGHDGGDLAFGPDGTLFITTGDGTSDSDGWNSGQTVDDLLGSVLRIDVDRRDEPLRYGVPPDNPFLKLEGARPELWAYGLRNPWRMSIDLPSGQVWVGNNGQDLWETAHLVRPGENYGWSVYEGSHPFYLNRRRGPTPHIPPTIEHSHALFRSLTGGVVYRGERFPELDGAYIYGDYSSGRIWGMKHDGQRPLWHRELADTQLQIAAFRVDQRGELLIVDHGGGLYRLARLAGDPPAAPFPRRLAETGLFASVKDHRAEPGLIPYSVNAPAWADGATAERLLAVPGDEPVGYSSSGSWSFPDGTALVETLSLECEPGDPATRVRVETRVLLRQAGEWAGYSYRWEEDGSDATLVPGEGADGEVVVRAPGGAGERRQSWRYPGREECMGCHSRAAGFVLGITEGQLNRESGHGEGRKGGDVHEPQLLRLERLGLFQGGGPRSSGELARLANPYDSAADLEARARAYLQVNCSVCHVEAGGGNSKMELGISTPRERMRLIGDRPQHDSFGLPNAMLVAPGSPQSSVLLHRLSRRGPGQMPPLVSRRVDESAVRLLEAWISSLKPARALVREWKPEDVLPSLDEAMRGRSFASGQAAFRDLGCSQCHRFAGDGGTVGPDLSGIARRQTAPQLLESILLPSKVIADEYAALDVETVDGTVVSGRIEREDAGVLVVRPTASSEAPVEIAKEAIQRRERSELSTMPSGVVNVLEREQLLDLLAYLLGDGDPGAPVFH